MNKNKNLIIGVIALWIIVLVFLIVRFLGERISPTGTGSTHTGITCGIQECHGLDVSCGKNIPEACTMEYRFWDRCRRFLSCSTSPQCTLIQSPEFTACKSCVEACEKYKDDVGAYFSCEASCDTPGSTWSISDSSQSGSKPTKCGIQECHGLDLTCGPNIPDACTASYVWGDICHKFAECTNSGNLCTFRENSDFRNCKSCVEACDRVKADPAEYFGCEAKCGEARVR